MPTLPTWLPASLVMLSAVIGALYVMLSAVATFATAFWPTSTAAHYLAAVVLDLAKIRSMLAGFLPGSVAKVAATTLAAMCFALGGCSLWSSIKPVLTADAEKFAACVYANLPEAIGDLVTLNAADAEQLALKCGGTAIDGATVQSMAGDKAKAKAAAASHAAPVASASAK